MRKRTRPSTNIVQSELGHERVELKEERERLADATGSAENGDFGELSSEEKSAIGFHGSTQHAARDPPTKDRLRDARCKVNPDRQRLRSSPRPRRRGAGFLRQRT